MENKRREFLKKAAVVGTIAAASSTMAMANTKHSKGTSDEGVVIGKSNKKEILYKKTQQWRDFYKSAM